MNNEWNLVEALRHARHDWMNRLQLIKGNMDLGRMDRAKQIIEEIVAEAQNESKLSNLRMPKFSEWMLTYNWQTHYIKLEFEVLEAEEPDIGDDSVFNWFTGLFSVLENCVKPFEENNMMVIIKICQQEARFELDFNGIIVDKENLQDWLEKNNAGLTIHNMAGNGFLISLSLNR
ncbi:Spo0B C-terminal domain-containing protein [Bacillus sp. P14.5]|uniref:Spo0B C-terminal domain-containing protein n=1 Tax=Bacillus sp. P14.5 TaxID=1983400 RepID=UPI000DE89E77|nr:Spo0B C-terminal domain-containing protein [Bacillus sp. P14.5]